MNMHDSIDKIEEEFIRNFKEEFRSRDINDDDKIQLRLDLACALIFQLHALGVDKDSLRNFLLDMVDESVSNLQKFKN
tara:strand:+ start:116 stop:349 length:234 start_codon:yes stop_codon:yes gene_type:complete